MSVDNFSFISRARNPFQKVADNLPLEPICGIVTEVKRNGTAVVVVPICEKTSEGTLTTLTLSGSLYGDFLLHKDKKRYVLTHIPSGTVLIDSEAIALVVDSPTKEDMINLVGVIEVSDLKFPKSFSEFVTDHLVPLSPRTPKAQSFNIGFADLVIAFASKHPRKLEDAADGHAN